MSKFCYRLRIFFKVKYVALLLANVSTAKDHFVDIWMKTHKTDDMPESATSWFGDVKWLNNYGYNRLQMDSFTFSVKASSNAEVLLCPTQGVLSDYYVIKIGNYYNSELLLQYYHNNNWADGKSEGIHNLLNEFEFRSFWISLNNNAISFGRGKTPSIDTLMEWPNVAFYIKSAAFSTDSGRVGLWILTVEANFNGFFSTCHERNIRGNMVIVKSMNQFSKYHCAGECSRLNTCLGFNYYTADQSCELIRTEQLVVVQREAVGWMFYRKCLQHTEGCLCD